MPRELKEDQGIEAAAEWSVCVPKGLGLGVRRSPHKITAIVFSSSF